MPDNKERNLQMSDVADIARPARKLTTLADLTPSQIAAIRKIPAEKDAVVVPFGATRPNAIFTGRERFDLEQEKIFRRYPAPVTVSALTGQGVDRMMAAVLEADRIWNMHISTAALNRFLEDALSRHPPPAIKGRRVKVRYMTQPKARPPTFALFGNQLAALPDSNLRYITNELRKAFGLKGVAIRYVLRGSKNPYA